MGNDDRHYSDEQLAKAVDRAADSYRPGQAIYSDAADRIRRSVDGREVAEVLRRAVRRLDESALSTASDHRKKMRRIADLFDPTTEEE